MCREVENEISIEGTGQKGQAVNEESSRKSKFESCEVGPFRLPGITVNTGEVTAEHLAEMQAWARENHAYVADNIISWRRRDLAKRDWFILRWS